MTVLMPKIFGRDLNGLLEWADRIIAFFEQEVALDEVASETIGLAGTILDRASTNATPPTGYLLCDGSVVSQAAYPDLFTAIGTAFNTGGEGAGNFRLPNQTVTIGSLAGCKRFINHG